MADELMDARDLNTMLDAIVSGETIPAAGVDAELLDTFRRLRFMGQTPLPESAQARVGQAVATAIADVARNPARHNWPSNGAASGAIRNDLLWSDIDELGGMMNAALTSPRALFALRTRFAAYVVAALLVLALGIGLLVRGPGLPRREHEKSIPAAQAPASPTALPSTDTTLLRVTLPAAALPKGEGISGGLAHFSIPPGTRSTWTPPCCPGPLIEYVVSGSYSVKAEVALKVVRTDGSIQDVAANEEITLGPGDALISRNETVVEGANTGAVPVELLGWVIIEDSGFGGHSLPGWLSGDASVQGDLVILPESMSVELRRVTLEPNSELPPPVAGTSQYAVVLPSNSAGTPVTAAVSEELSGGALIYGPEPVEVYVLTAEQTVPPNSSPAAGTPAP